MTTTYLNTDIKPLPVFNKCSFANQNPPLGIKLEEIIEFYPESERIIKLADDFFDKIHANENQEKVSLFFKQVMIENEAIFKKLSLQEKAQLLFDLYKATIFPILKNDSVYSSAISALREKISELKATTWPDVEDIDSIPILIDKLIDREINRLYSICLEFAICKALETSALHIKFSGEAAPLLNQKENINISQHAFELFQAFSNDK